MKTNTEIRKYIKEAIGSNHPVQEIETVIDIVKQDMINDFDSRICENCIYKVGCEIRNTAITVHGNSIPNFGCSDWEAK